MRNLQVRNADAERRERRSFRTIELLVSSGPLEEKERERERERNERARFDALPTFVSQGKGG